MSSYGDFFHGLMTSSGSQWKFKSPENMQFYLKYLRSSVDKRPPPAMYTTLAIDEESVRGRPLYNLQFRRREARKHVIFLHGGSYVNPMAAIHWQFVQRLMMGTSCSVSVPLYGLAPQYNFRDAYQMLRQHYLELLERKAPEDIIFLGDSAGGGLALALTQWLPTQGLPSPGGLAMISPWLDITLSNPHIDQVQPRDSILAVPGNQEAGRLWAAGEDPENPMLSPIYGTMTNLPPMSLMIGTHDILLPDARRLAERAQAVGADLDYQEYPEMFHLWALLPTIEGFAALEKLQAFISSPQTVQ